MGNVLNDEIISNNSIYGEDTLKAEEHGPTVCTLRLPSLASVVLRLEFPPDYPDSPPVVLGTDTVGDDAPKGLGKSTVNLTRKVLGEIYEPGNVCIYDLIEAISPLLESGEYDSAERRREDDHNGSKIRVVDSAQQPRGMNVDLGPEPPWTLSDVVTEKKSVFIARAAATVSVAQATQFIRHYLTTDKKAARATHNITAWRIRGEDNIPKQDCDDDGEDAAGGRMLHVMQMMDVWDVVVIVTRWYGGIHLGPDRFRIINTVTREALIRGGHFQDKDIDSRKTKGRK